MKTALIITGGEFFDYIPTPPADLIIACDKGCEYAKRLGLTPQLIIGDFDSLSTPAEDYFPEAEVMTYPVMKDDTDTMLAIKYALANGCDRLIITCGLGGRMDHLISNLQSLHYIAAHGATGELYGNGEHLQTLSASDGPLTLQEKAGYSLSLFSLTDKCEGLTITGAKYSVKDVTLTSHFPLGHGNSFVEKEVTISLRSGILLLVESLL